MYQGLNAAGAQHYVWVKVAILLSFTSWLRRTNIAFAGKDTHWGPDLEQWPRALKNIIADGSNLQTREQVAEQIVLEQFTWIIPAWGRDGSKGLRLWLMQ